MNFIAFGSTHQKLMHCQKISVVSCIVKESMPGININNKQNTNQMDWLYIRNYSDSPVLTWSSSNAAVTGSSFT